MQRNAKIQLFSDTIVSSTYNSFCHQHKSEALPPKNYPLKNDTLTLKKWKEPSRILHFQRKFYLLIHFDVDKCTIGM